MKKILLLDAPSYTIPFNIEFIKQYCKEYSTTLFASYTKYNQELLEDEHNLNFKLFNISNVGKIVGIINYLRLILHTLFISNKYDLILIQWPIFLPFELLLLILLRSKIRFIIHNHIEHDSRKKKLIFRIIRHLNLQIIFVSENTKRSFIETYGNVTKEQVLPHPLFEPLNKNNHDHSKNKPIITFLGNIKKYKGLDFIEQIKKHDKFTESSYEILGKCNPECESLMNKIQSLNNVCISREFLSIDNIKALFNEQRIFILPYKNITQSGMFYLLISNEQFFIASRTGDIKDYCTKYNLEELLFDREDIESYFRCIENIKNNNTEIKEKITKAKKRYLSDLCKMKVK